MFSKQDAETKLKQRQESLNHARKIRRDRIEREKALPSYGQHPTRQIKTGPYQKRGTKTDVQAFRETKAIRADLPGKSVIVRSSIQLKQDLLSQFDGVTITPPAMIVLKQITDLWEESQLLRSILDTQKGIGVASVFEDQEGHIRPRTAFTTLLSVENALRRALSQLDGYLREARTQHARSGGRGKVESVIDVFRQTQRQKVECQDVGRAEDAEEEL